MDFSGGPVVKHVPASAGDTGLIPGLGISHAGGQLSPCAATADAGVPQSHHSATREATTISPPPAVNSSPCLLQLEKAPTQRPRM